jgi:hypothetical protein
MGMSEEDVEASETDLGLSVEEEAQSITGV